MSALRKNVASQVLTFVLVNATTGAALTGASVTTKVTLDGTQSAGAGTVTELGTGQYKYVPTQAETNGASVGLSFTATNAVPVNLQCFTTADNPATTTASLVWDAVSASYVTAGTTGALLAAAGAATDPLLNAVPGAYGVGTAGAALGAITTAAVSVTFTGPVASGGNASVIQGDDYNNTDDRALEWSITDDIVLTGATVTFYSNMGGTLFSKALTVTTATGPTKIMYLELTAAQTAAFALGTHGFDLRAVLASARVATILYTGKISVTKKQA